MRKIFYCVLAVIVFTFSSCEAFFTAGDEFFGSSFGTPQHDVSSVNAGNVDKWLESARMNPKLADSLLQKIRDDLEGGRLSGQNKAKFMDAGLTLSLQTAGLGTSLISEVSGILGKMADIKDTEAAKALLTDIQDIFGGKAGVAAENISAIAGAGITTRGNIPQFDSDYINYGNPNPTDVALAVVILTLGELGDTPINWDDPDALKDSLDITITENGVTTNDPGLKTLAAYVNLISEGGPEFDKNPITSFIKDSFKYVEKTIDPDALDNIDDLGDLFD